MMDLKAQEGTTTGTPMGALLDPHNMTTEQLAELGLQEIAYVRPVMTDDGPAFGVFAANGTPLGLAPDHNLARAAIVQHEMAPVSVH